MAVRSNIGPLCHRTNDPYTVTSEVEITTKNITSTEEFGIAEHLRRVYNWRISKLGNVPSNRDIKL